MEIDINKIVSADEIGADIPQINKVLAEKDEMLVFGNNKPQFVILSFEKYEQLMNGTSNACNSISSEPKIGKLVQDSFLKLVDKELLPPEEIERLCQLEYSNSTFSLNFPMLKEFNPDPNVPIDVQKRDSNGYNRYYKYLIEIYNKQYLLCSQWNEMIHRRKYLNWLEQWG